MTKEKIEILVKSVVTDYCSNNNILIVCHGFFMHTFQKELKTRGFSGKHIKRPKNGTLYLYKK